MSYVKEPQVDWILSHKYWNNYYCNFNFQEYQTNQTVYYFNDSENRKMYP